MTVELEVKVPRDVNDQQIEACVRETFEGQFGHEDARKLDFIINSQVDGHVLDMTIKFNGMATVSVEFFAFDDGESAESGNWCTLSANLNRSKITYALMCIVACALGKQFNTPVIDDSLWLGTTREVSVLELENRIGDHAQAGLLAATDIICKSLGIAGTR